MIKPAHCSLYLLCSQERERNSFLFFLFTATVSPVHSQMVSVWMINSVVTFVLTYVGPRDGKCLCNTHTHTHTHICTQVKSSFSVIIRYIIRVSDRWLTKDDFLVTVNSFLDVLLNYSNKNWVVHANSKGVSKTCALSKCFTSLCCIISCSWAIFKLFTSFQRSLYCFTIYWS